MDEELATGHHRAVVWMRTSSLELDVASRSWERPIFSATRWEGTLFGRMIAMRRLALRASRAWSRPGLTAAPCPARGPGRSRSDPRRPHTLILRPDAHDPPHHPPPSPPHP